MNPMELSFRALIQPMKPEDFFARDFGQVPAFISGTTDKFSDIFSWAEANRLLNISKIWSSQSLRLLHNGQPISPSVYCYESSNRDRNRINRPDPPAVMEALRAGAILVMDELQTLCPPIAAVAASLQLALDGVATCTALCAWERQQQAPHPYFDVGEGFAIQITGTTTWRVYQGRFEHPGSLPDHSFSGLTEEQHRTMRGGLAMQYTAKPGDLLYIPSGQYYQTMFDEGPCLYLWFEILRPVGNDFSELLLELLVEEPAFREPLPHFDALGADSGHFRGLADRLRHYYERGDIAAQMRLQQKQRAARRCFPRYSLPNRDEANLYRVRWHAAGIVKRGADWQLMAAGGMHALTAEELEFANWVLDRDYFSADGFARSFPSHTPEDLETVTARLSEIGLIERLGNSP